MTGKDFAEGLQQNVYEFSKSNALLLRTLAKNRYLGTHERLSIFGEGEETYEISEDELVKTLNNFIDSLENYGDEPLPPYKRGKTWEELFPENKNGQFGYKGYSKQISAEAYQALGHIYQDWQEEQQVKDELIEEELKEKLYSETFDLSLVLHTLKSSAERSETELTKLNARYQQGLTDYETLNSLNQEELKDDLAGVNEGLNQLKKLTPITQETNSNNLSPGIGKGGIGLGILLGLALLGKTVTNFGPK